jgi:nucleoside-diphosphate-sugar epimerase
MAIMSSPPNRLPFNYDIEYVLEGVGEAWMALKKQSILITGGTGIIGKWLIATLLQADHRLELEVTVTVVSRNPNAFRRDYPVFAENKRLTWVKGDVRKFTLPKDAKFSHVIHAATDVVAAKSAEDLLDSCITGTRHVIKHARRCGASRLLLLSSGAVYGKTPQGLGAIPETFMGLLDCLSSESAYAEGKRVSEMLCAIENEKGKIGIPIARCFAMVGPYLPLDKHFAIGNFIDSVIHNKPITIKGDGTPVRSYMYMSDVALRLWLLLLKGRGGLAYNVGDDEPMTIEELARLVVSTLKSKVDIRIENQTLHGAHANTYYPDTTRLRFEFGLDAGIGLEEAIRRTAAWHQIPQSIEE